MKATIKDVAKLAGVSKSTVSRVLNNADKVSDQARKAVLEAQQVLGYQPNRVAQSLVKRNTMTIGVLVPDLRNPHYAHACWAAERVIQESDYSILICNTDNKPELEDKYLQVLRDRQVDGVLVIGGTDDVTSIIDFRVKEHIPLVLVDRPVKGYNLPSIVMDNISGGGQGTDYLLDLGHKRIAFATSDFTKAERDRGRGYKRSLESRGILPDPNLYVSISEEQWKMRQIPEIEGLFSKNDPPTAIFASNDIKALTLYNVLQKMGLSIPNDVSLVGFDDIDLATLVSPPLTTVAQPIDEMAQRGALMLIALLNGDEVPKKLIQMNPSLIKRESARELNEE